MIIAVIKVETYEKVIDCINSIYDKCSAIELRLDYCHFSNLKLQNIIKLCNRYRKKIIFTLRKNSQGGFYASPESERHNYLVKLLSFNPDFIDLEYDTPSYIINSIKGNNSNIKLICSYHDFIKTPVNLDKILYQLKKNNFNYYKIACYANCFADTIKMVELIKKNKKYKNFTGISMGEIGKKTRLLSIDNGNCMHYMAADMDSLIAPGQITLAEFLSFSKSGQC